MKNWKTTLAGSVSAVGVFLFGVPVACKAAGFDFIDPPIMKLLVLLGVAMQGLGILFSNIFSADAKNLKGLEKKMEETREAVRSGNTIVLTRTMADEAEKKASENKGN